MYKNRDRTSSPECISIQVVAEFRTIQLPFGAKQAESRRYKSGCAIWAGQNNQDVSVNTSYGTAPLTYLNYQNYISLSHVLSPSHLIFLIQL